MWITTTWWCFVRTAISAVFELIWLLYAISSDDVYVKFLVLSCGCVLIFNKANRLFQNDTACQNSFSSIAVWTDASAMLQPCFLFTQSVSATQLGLLPLQVVLNGLCCLYVSRHTLIAAIGTQSLKVISKLFSHRLTGYSPRVVVPRLYETASCSTRLGFLTLSCLYRLFVQPTMLELFASPCKETPKSVNLSAEVKRARSRGSSQ